MTREEAKQKIYNASKNDTSSPNNCIHLLSLHAHIENIFSDFDAHASDLRCVIDRYMEEAAMYKNVWERAMDEHEAQIKAKDDEIDRLKRDLTAFYMLLDEPIDKKSRSIVAMLFWEYKKLRYASDEYFHSDEEIENAYFTFKKAYKMLKDNK